MRDHGQALDGTWRSGRSVRARRPICPWRRLPRGSRSGQGRTAIGDSDLTRVERSFSDVYGRPVLTLRVDVPRRITAQGRTAVAYATAYLVGAAVLALLALLIVLNRVVLEPLARVTRHAVAIGEGSDLGARLSLDSRDEIGRLAQEFDGMVARVEQSASAARRSILPCGIRGAREGRAAQFGQCHDAAGRPRGEARRKSARGAGRGSHRRLRRAHLRARRRGAECGLCRRNPSVRAT